MRINTRANLFSFILLSFIFTDLCYSQNISINLNIVDSLITTNSENLIFDVNGEICSLVILTTDLDSLKFYSNLGVEKITKTNVGYRIWLPNHATVLKFVISGYPLFEYKLPHSIYKYSVYIISLKVENYGKIILKDTIQSSLSISTTPVKARIYLNGKYVGKSPFIIKKPPFLVFNYSLRKKAYASYASTDSMDINKKNISVDLVDLSKSKRYFAILNIIGDGLSKSQVDSHGMPGITFGVFGKTGFYGSLNLLFVNDTVVKEPYNTIVNYFNYNKGQKIRVATGISYQVIKPVFLYGGPCYTRRTYQREGYLDGKSQSLNLNIGVLFRIGWYSLLQIDYCPGINNSYSSIGFGLGYNFSKKRKSPTIQKMK